MILKCSDLRERTEKEIWDAIGELRGDIKGIFWKIGTMNGIMLVLVVLIDKIIK
jgi:hypothetical protein